MECNEDFTLEKQCQYNGEKYLVRNNGAVFRLPLNGKKPRKLDNHWTFGKKNESNGYLYLGNHRVHIIVATAFHGSNDSKKLVVDHIDTNRCNNRPENLRWLTRLENILNNPFTRKKVEYICGSIEKFLEDPQLLFGHESEDSNFQWMRSVTKEEAANTLANMKKWLKKEPSGQSLKSNVGEWIYKPQNKSYNRYYSYPRLDSYENAESEEELEEYKPSLSPNALQSIEWKTPTSFPKCPPSKQETGLQAYYDNLEIGKPVSMNIYGTVEVKDKALMSDQIIVKCEYAESAIKPYSILIIKIDESGQYLHECFRTFFEEDGANKYFTLLQDKEWEGGDVFDDFC